MEDAATAEISRSQVWQWLKHGRFSRAEVGREIEAWREREPRAAALFEQVATADEFVEFLTLPAYQLLA
jgi:malate synthase